MTQSPPGLIEYAVSAPGRVNLLGEHVDYNQGIVMPAAIDRRVNLRARSRQDRLLHLHAVDLNDSVIVPLDELPSKLDADAKPLPTWALYPAGVAWALEQHGFDSGGMDVTFSSDVPIGAGLSSSAAVEVAFASLWQLANGWRIEGIDLALLCQQAEMEYVGVNCGAMDQITSACGVKDHVLVIDLRSKAVVPIQLPEEAAIVIADSGVRRALTNSGYNERHAACEEAVRRLKQTLPGIESLRDVSLKDFNRFFSRLPGPPSLIRGFARHVVEEMARVEAGIHALKSGDIEVFGQLMLACHASLRDLYLASTNELDLLVDIARGLPGCWGSRLTGAGFGGCTVNLVQAGRVEAFSKQLAFEYNARTGGDAQIYACRASQGTEARAIT